jgi:anaerobic dimethyl sulfoxide reductase subunit B (iron-sulfur subunit)
MASDRSDQGAGIVSKQLGFYFDASACTGCKTCVLACKDRHDNPIGVNFRKVIHYTGGSWEPHPTQEGIMVPHVYAYMVSVSCNHCAVPVCLDACPPGAISKRDNGLVAIDKDICLGCRLCECCPYDAPQFNEERGVMTLCDGCQDSIFRGERQRCVAACPQRALQFGDIEELRAQYGSVSGIEPLPNPEITVPSLVVTPHRNSPLSGQGTGKAKVDYPIVVE